MSEGILGGVFSDGIKDKLKTFLKDEYQSLKLEKEIQEYLDSEQNRYLTKNEGWDYDFDVLRNTLLYYIFDETSLFNVFSEDKNTIAIEFDKIITKCCQDSHAMGISSTEKIKSIITHCYEIVYKFHYTQESPNQLEMHNRTIYLVNATIDESEKKSISNSNQNTEAILDQMADYHNKEMEAISFNNIGQNSHQTAIKTDNRYYFETFRTSLFLDRDDARITLKEMYIDPLVSSSSQNISDYLSEWKDTLNSHLLLLLGDAGSGKSSLIAKIVDDAYQEYDYQDNHYGDQSVLAIALREHCNIFSDYLHSESPNMNELLCKLYGINSPDVLRDKLLILDGFDELMVLISDFDDSAALNFIDRLSTTCHNRRLKMIITSRDTGIQFNRNPNIKIETLCWKEMQVENWCTKYRTLKPSVSEWTNDFLNQYHELSKNSNLDKRNEILCVPFILYLCCFNKIDLSNNSTVCKIYDESFRKLLNRAHTEDLIGADRLDENKTEEELRIINWQFTKEIAYQMFLIDDLTLSDVQDSSNIQYSALQLAKQRTIEVVFDRFRIKVQTDDLQTAKLLAVFSFARSDGGSGITFAHKSVYEYFTAVKLYEDYFANLNDHIFDQLSPEEQIATVIQNTIEAFRYKPIPNDIFEYLCGLCSDSQSPFGMEIGHPDNRFVFESYSKLILNALSNNCMYTTKIRNPNPAYLHLDIHPKMDYRFYRYRGGMNPHSIHMQLSRSFANLTWFLSMQGFTNSNSGSIRWNSDSLFVPSDQRVYMRQWDLRGMNLNGAHLEKAILSHANLSHAFLTSANLSEARLSNANLSRARLIKSNLSRTSLIETNMDKAYLREADLRDARILFATLTHSSLRSTNLCHAILSRSNLSYADLREADLSFAKIKCSDFSNADLRGANLRGADIIETDFTNAKYSIDNKTRTIFPDGFNPEEHGMILDETEN